MPGRIEMGRAMRGQANPFDTPALPVGKFFLFHAGKKFENVTGRGLVIEIFDLRPIARRIGCHVVFERHGNVD